MTGPSGPGAEAGTGGGWRPRRRLVAVVAVVVGGLGAVIWWLWPEREPAIVLYGGTGRYLVAVTVGDRVGMSDVGIRITDRNGKPLPDAQIRVQAVEPRMGYAAEPVTAVATAAGDYRAAQVPFMMSGPWEVRVSITGGDGADELALPLWISG